LGATAVAVAGAVAAPATVLAGTDGDVVLGSGNSASTRTTISNSSSDAAISGENDTDQSAAVVGWNKTAAGIAGASGPLGFGIPNYRAGVVGFSIADRNSLGVVGVSDAGTGVWGASNDGDGVLGRSDGAGGGVGVRGAGISGPGLSAISHSTSSPGAIGYSWGHSTGVEGFSGGDNSTPPPSQPDTGVLGSAPSPGRGVHGFSGAGAPPAAPADPIGVFGESNGADPTGVWGEGGTATTGSTTGVYGEGDTGVWGFGGWGVFGASDATGTGMYGLSAASVPAAPAHTGVFGYSDGGTGVYAKAATGTALYVSGKASFSRSGKIAITAGHSAAAKTLAGVTTSSLIIAVLQTYRAGYYLAAAVPAAGKFTVYLNKVATSTMTVAFFVVN
jgi:hypothetical protein